MNDNTKAVEEMANNIPNTVMSYNGNPQGQKLYIEQRKQIATALIAAHYRPESEVRAEAVRELADMFKSRLDKIIVENTSAEIPPEKMNWASYGKGQDGGCLIAMNLIYELANTFKEGK